MAWVEGLGMWAPPVTATARSPGIHTRPWVFLPYQCPYYEQCVGEAVWGEGGTL